MITEERKEEKPSAPDLVIRSIYEALAADPEKGLTRSRGRTSPGIPAARQTGEMKEDSASAAPDEENIDTAHMIRVSDGIRENDVLRPFFAPSKNMLR